jgi:DNA-binding LytR/AlgR family response regulator
MTLKGVLEKLPPSGFSSIHRSYIVANNKVKSIQNKESNAQLRHEVACK